MGVGGGLFANLLMTFYGRPIHQAVATSSAIAVLISIPGAIGYVYAGWPAAARFPDVTALQMPFAIGYVSLIGALLVMPTSLITAPLGVRAAHAMSKREAGDGVRGVYVHRRRKVRDQPVVRLRIARQPAVVVPANAGTHNHRCQWFEQSRSNSVS